MVFLSTETPATGNAHILGQDLGTSNVISTPVYPLPPRAHGKASHLQESLHLRSFKQ